MELDPERQAFVDAVMKPLGDDGARRELLEKAVALAETLPPPANGDRIRRATDRMESTARRFPLRHRIGLAAVTAVVLVVPWLTVAGPAARESLAAIWTGNLTTAVTSTACCSRPEVPTLPGITDDEQDHRFIRHIEKQVSPPGLALLAGDFLQESPSAQWKPLWDSHPRDPWHYFAYAISFQREHKRWPERFVETGEELDPGNGWFRLMRGASRMEAAIGFPPPPRITSAEKLAARAKGLPPPKAPYVEKPARVVVDPKAFQEGWDDLATALAMPRLDDYTERLNAIRLDAFPAAVDYPDLCSYQVLSYGQPEDFWSGWGDLKRYAEAFGFAADQAAKAGDKEKLLELGRLHSRIVRSMCRGSSGVFPGMIARHMAQNGGLGLSKAWSELGDAAEAKRYQTLADQLSTKLHPDPQAPPDALTERRGSHLVNSATSFRSSGSNPVSRPVTEPELRGGRLAEYAMYERLMMHAVAVLLTLALAFLLFVPWRSRRDLGLLPSRLAGLLDRRDHAWIALLGVLLPAGLYVFSTRVPWMEPREFSLSGDRFYLWLAQAAALVVAVVLGTLQAARWRLGRRGTVLALGWVGVDPGRVLFPVTLALIPIASVLSKLADSWNQSDPLAAVLIASLLAFPLLWLAMLARGCFHSASERTLHRATLMVAARPFVAAAMLATAFAIPAIHREEKHWTAQADFDVLKSGHTVFVPRFEVEYGRWIAQETLRRLDEMEK
jgi:hypothetical protein